MPKLTDTVMIKVGGRERAVKVTIDAPTPAELDVQMLAQETWSRTGRKLKKGNVTVIVRAFGR